VPGVRRAGTGASGAGPPGGLPAIAGDSVSVEASHLSGGQQQSIAIARAVHFNAKVIIMDEPTSALSISETAKVLDYVRQLKEKGIAVIMISHRVQHVFQVSDRIMVLRHGEKVMDSALSDTTEEQVIRKIIGIDTQNNARKAKEIPDSA
jgi:ABC-type sugar transport system ATPase subunit